VHTPTDSSDLRLDVPSELPVSQRVDDITAAIESHQVTIVAGATGSGKTTQLPKIALRMGRKRIAHTQPRRIAARSVAERIAEETGTELGGVVGYQVRFADQVSEHTRVRLMTDGILLNAIHRDRLLQAYDTIIIDEAHERSLNIDFLLGYLKTILPKRPDLKVIITSATIDPQSFSEHFDNAPIIEVSGRGYPVEVRYRPLAGAADNNRESNPESGDRDLYDAIGDALVELLADGPGDTLVFLSGEAEIRDAAETLEGRFSGRLHTGRKLEVLPLFGRLSAADQHRIFHPSRDNSTRVVLATNVAETSLTVPGIIYVIDGGTARISRYSSRSKVQRLPIEPISQASAIQRAGRTGRISPGTVIRLYSEDDYLSRPEFTDPEILRTGLASVILQMLSLGLGNTQQFPFLTPPDTRGVKDGLTLLSELGAVHNGRITAVGRALSRLPIEPRFGRMILEAHRRGVSRDVIAIVAGLTVQDVRERPEAERAQADQLHARFQDPQGDLMTLLNLWNYLKQQRDELSSSAFRRACKREYLNYLRVREWTDLTQQLTRALREIPRKLRAGSKAGGPTREGSGDSAETIHKAILSGLLSHIGVRDEKQRAERAHLAKISRGRKRQRQEYLGSRGSRFVIHPSSVLTKSSPETLMSVELVETSRLFARMNAIIDPGWAEQLAGDLAKRSHSDPHWEEKQGAAIALESVTLFGVRIISERKVQLKRVDPELARQLFIRHALVQGEWEAHFAFERHNAQLRHELEQIENRTRQRGLVGDDDAVFEFYDERIPRSVATVRDFEGWWKKAQKSTPKLLHLSREQLLTEAGEQRDCVDEEEFPREWHSGDQSLKLNYRFEPGAEDDGVTVAVPLPLLPRLREQSFEQLVPGLREELVANLIKTLPKSIRKHVVPANDWAKTLLAAIQPALEDSQQQESLMQLLAAEIRRRASVPVTAADFDHDRLPSHLRPTFRVIDGRGRTLGTGKDLAKLQHRHRSQAAENVAQVTQRTQAEAAKFQRKELTAWTFGNLREHVDAQFAAGRGGAGTVRAYPTLVDRKSSVDLVLAATQAEQRNNHRRGVRRLVFLSSPSPASYVRDHLANDEKLLLGAGPYRTLSDVVNDICLAIADEVIEVEQPDGMVRDTETFERITNRYASELIDRIYSGVELTVRVLREARAARKSIDSAKSLQVLGQVSDASAQLEALVWADHSGTGFVSRTGLNQLTRLPVYLRAIQQRMQQLPQNPGRDRARQNEIDQVSGEYRGAGGQFPTAANQPRDLVAIRWQIEELRVSLFAQQLGAQGKISTQRLRKSLAQLDEQSLP
jgi:ATP-dependent helicase HrpA